MRQAMRGKKEDYVRLVLCACGRRGSEEGERRRKERVEYMSQYDRVMTVGYAQWGIRIVSYRSAWKKRKG